MKAKRDNVTKAKYICAKCGEEYLATAKQKDSWGVRCRKCVSLRQVELKELNKNLPSTPRAEHCQSGTWAQLVGVMEIPTHCKCGRPIPKGRIGSSWCSRECYRASWSGYKVSTVEIEVTENAR